MRPSILTASKTSQSGQALTEFLVSAVVLVPLFLLIPMIGKYQDIATSTQLASRYVAFEAAVNNDSTGNWTAPDKLAGQVQRRFFSKADAPIKTDDVALDDGADRNPLWTSPRGDALIDTFNQDIRVSFGPQNSPGQAQGFTGASDDKPFIGANTGFSLKARGIYTGGVSASLKDLPQEVEAYRPLDRIALTITRRTSVLIDHWSGRDASDVQNHLDHPTVYPSSAIKGIKPVIEVAVRGAELYPPWDTIKAPKVGELGFWKDVVPQDRLYAP